MPSLSWSSSAIRASPQIGFSAAILRMGCRRLFGSRGRPRGLDFHRQNRRNPFRCQRMKVSGLTTRSAERQAKSLPTVAITNRIESVAQCGFALRSSNRASKRPGSNSTARPVVVARERAVIRSHALSMMA